MSSNLDYSYNYSNYEENPVGKKSPVELDRSKPNRKMKTKFYPIVIFLSVAFEALLASIYMLDITDSLLVFSLMIVNLGLLASLVFIYFLTIKSRDIEIKNKTQS